MKILLPVDGSECAMQTLNWVSETFRKEDTVYYLLFVIPVLPDLNTVEFDIVDATEMLRHMSDRLKRAGCRVERAEYILGDTVEQICRHADELEVDQIVLGSHGRTGLSKLLMGSTSIKVLERSRKPVTIHRMTNIRPTTNEQQGSREIGANTLL